MKPSIKVIFAKKLSFSQEAKLPPSYPVKKGKPNRPRNLSRRILYKKMNKILNI
jgi:hypothetical protein